ncbi:DMT family transporter [Halovivax gelatinilyticus]|uniref:DMT family transporter n=1 Tax=Halovivax gelatinilyticus TaxID=2961597 RepID=UPI0020CA42DD|nr:DMT family transporter [Halovivax gelatinilyticus]
MSRRNAAGFVLLSAVWGTSFPAVRAGVQEAPPVLFAALRFDAMAILVLGLALVVDGRWRPRRADIGGILAGGVLIVAVHHAFLFAGQQYVTSAVAAVVVATVPILAAGFSRFVLPSERLSLLGLVGLGLGFLGTAVVADPNPATLTAVHAIGVGLVFASAVALALGTVLVQWTRTDMPVLAMQGWMMLAGAPLLHAASLGLGEPQSVTWTPTVVIALAYLVPVAGVGGYLLYFHLLDELGSVELTLVNYVLPVFAALVGWVALGEGLEVPTVVGFAIVAIGFALVKRRALQSLLRRRMEG